MLKNITKNNIKTIHIVQSTAHFVPDTNVGHKKMPAAGAASKSYHSLRYGIPILRHTFSVPASVNILFHCCMETLTPELYQWQSSASAYWLGISMLQMSCLAYRLYTSNGCTFFTIPISNTAFPFVYTTSPTFTPSEIGISVNSIFLLCGSLFLFFCTLPNVFLNKLSHKEHPFCVFLDMTFFHFLLHILFYKSNMRKKCACSNAIQKNVCGSKKNGMLLRIKPAYRFSFHYIIFQRCYVLLQITRSPTLLFLLFFVAVFVVYTRFHLSLCN